MLKISNNDSMSVKNSHLEIGNKSEVIMVRQEIDQKTGDLQ